MLLRIIPIRDGKLEHLSTDVDPLLVDVTLGMLKSLAHLGCPKPGLSKLPRCQKKPSVKFRIKIKWKDNIVFIPASGIILFTFTLNQSKYLPSK